ncbi:MAG: hypothetical protein ACXABO_00875 [Promethearchaeota archaeon]
MLELKERAEERDFLRLKRAQEIKDKLLELNDLKQRNKHDKQGYKLRKLQMKMIYNPNYCEEKEKLLRDREARIAYLNLLYSH